MNGQMVPWEQATVHVMSHALHYGSSVFEGIRVYKTPDGPQVFRLTDHMRRFFESAKIYRMPVGYECDELIEVCKELIRANGLMNGAYIRPIAFRGYGEPGLAPKADHKVDVAIAAWEQFQFSVGLLCAHILGLLCLDGFQCHRDAVERTRADSPFYGALLPSATTSGSALSYMHKCILYSAKPLLLLAVFWVCRHFAAGALLVL